MHITPFAVEMWMNAWKRCSAEPGGETWRDCVDSLTVAELLE